MLLDIQMAKDIIPSHRRSFSVLLLFLWPCVDADWRQNVLRIVVVGFRQNLLMKNLHKKLFFFVNVAEVSLDLDGSGYGRRVERRINVISFNSHTPARANFLWSRPSSHMWILCPKKKDSEISPISIRDCLIHFLANSRGEIVHVRTKTISRIQNLLRYQYLNRNN